MINFMLNWVEHEKKLDNLRAMFVGRIRAVSTVPVLLF